MIFEYVCLIDSPDRDWLGLLNHLWGWCYREYLVNTNTSFIRKR